MSIDQRTAPAARTITLWLLRLTVAGALGVSAAIHLDLAATYDAVTSSSISQGDLFRLEALAAVIAAVAVVLVQRWWAALPALLVALGSLVAVLAYRYVDVGAIGPIPSMYEPAWYPEKTWSAVAEAVTAIGALGLLALTAPRHAARR